ncbi:MAG: insulinase family protein [Treponema sp.]|jgi:zinc protease|nr:insulinase family protein [Treponema sp.]
MNMKSIVKNHAVLRYTLIACIVSLVLSASVAGCAGLSAGKSDIYGGLGKPSDPVPLMDGLRTGTLPNGLRYYIVPNARPENRAFLTLAVNAGSILETDDEQGLAHFVEHMAFNGTKRFPKLELLNYLRSLGMRFGPDVNAYTSYDETVFGIEAPVETGEDGIKRIPANALAVIDDWTYAVAFDPEDVDEERPVIIEEYRSRLGAMERVWRRLTLFLLEGSLYAERLPIGLPEIIMNAPASKLERFYRKWYRADNMAVILAGDFDADALEAELSSHFTAPPPAGVLDRPDFELPAPRKGNFRSEIITDPEFTYTRVDAYYKGVPRPLAGTLEAYRDSVMDYLIAEMVSKRFDEAVLKPETPYSGAGAWDTRYGKESNFHTLTAIAKPGAIRESLAEIMRQKESLVRYGFTNAEIDRAKRSLLSTLSKAVFEKDRQESGTYVSALVRHFLQGASAPDAEWELDAVTRLLPGIGAGELGRRVKSYYNTGDLTVVIIGPEQERADLPGEAEIRKIIAEAEKAKIARPVNVEISGELLDEDPAPGSITGETVDAETGSVIWELSNGARIILKPTANKNNEIALYALAPGGTAAVPETDFISARLAAEMALASGVGPYSRTELAQKLAGKQVSMSFSTFPLLRSLNASSTSDDLKSLFELVYLSFTQSRIDADAATVVIDQYRTSLIRARENPEEVFYEEVYRLLYGDDYRFIPARLEDLEKFDIATARRFLAQALNPAGCTFVFVGNLDIALMRPYVETYLASIPAGDPASGFPDVVINRPQKTLRHIYKGREEKSIVFQAWIAPETFDISDSITALVLSEYLDIRLTEEIREKLGGVYSIWVDFSLNALPPPGELAMEIEFSCDPVRVEELIAEVSRQIEMISRGEIDSDTFAKAVEALKKSHESAIQRNSYIANYYANLVAIFNQPLSFLDRRPDLYGAVRTEDMKDICIRLLPHGPATLILYPETSPQLDP